jgi:MerR family copper efflux transcriptional regulator
MAGLTIGELARRAGVGVETVRFYERQGLVPPPPRSGSGYRQYPQETVSRLRFIQRAKELGFSLREIEELISLRLDPEVPCAEVRARAEAKIADIDTRLRDLARMRVSLAGLADACAAGGSGGACPILDALNEPESE